MHGHTILKNCEQMYRSESLFAITVSASFTFLCELLFCSSSSYPTFVTTHTAGNVLKFLCILFKLTELMPHEIDEP